MKTTELKTEKMSEDEKLFLSDIHEKIYQIAGDDADLTRKLQQLAFGILVNIDGESAFIPPFKLISDGKKDIAGNLHNNFYRMIGK